MREIMIPLHAWIPAEIVEGYMREHVERKKNLGQYQEWIEKEIWI